MNLPNKLTMGRMLAVPILIVFLTLGHYYISAIIFILASLTDMLDGMIARKYNMITNFGKIMDPLADKLLVISVLVCLVQLGDVQGWMLIIILAREFAITGLRAVAAAEGVVIAAGTTGKIKTVLQMMAIIALLFQNWINLHIGTLSVGFFGTFFVISLPVVLLLAAVVMTVVSGIEYIIKNRQIFSL